MNERTMELVGAAVVVAAAFTGTAILAAMNNFVCEDAMIYLRYARNLAEGRGLVYNPGEYYESNTSFLWSILLVPAFWFGADPVNWFRFVGLASALAAIAATYIVSRQAGTRRDAVFAAVLLGFHSSFASFAFIGFAPHLPSLFALAAAACAFQMAKTARPAFALAAGLCMILLMMSRLDAVVIAAPVGLFVLWAAAQNKQTMPLNLALCAALPAALFAAYLLAKHAYYGDIFPATYYAKASLPEHLKEWYDAPGRAMKYTWLYALEYWFVFAAPFVLWGAHKMAKNPAPRGKNKKGKRAKVKWQAEQLLLLACAAAVLLWGFYIARIGGGYYEFRFWVTAAPFLFILAARALRELAFPLAAAVAAALILASFLHAASYDKSPGTTSHLDGIAYSFDSIGVDCHDPVKYEHTRKQYAALGDFFGEEFDDYSDELKFVTKAGGFFPYHTRFHSLEARGWADSRVFEDGNNILVGDPTPGHQRIVSPKIVNDLSVHFWTGDTRMHDITDNAVAERGGHNVAFAVTPPYGLMFPLGPDVIRQIPKDAKVVELPAGEKKMYAIYWTRTKKLDDFFARKNIALHDISPR